MARNRDLHPAEALLQLALDAVRRGNHRDGLQRCEEVLVLLPPGDDAGRALATRLLALNQWRLGKPEAAVHTSNRALALYRALGDAAGEGEALVSLCMAFVALGLYRDALDTAVRALAAARESGDRRIESWALNRIGVAYEALEDPELAARYLHEALALARSHGGEEEQFAAMCNLSSNALVAADCHLRAGNVDAARAASTAARSHATEALALARRSGNTHREVVALGNLAEALTHDDDIEAATALLTEYHQLAELHGYRPFELTARYDLACLLQRGGQHVEAVEKLVALLLALPAEGNTDMRRKVEHALYASNKALGRPAEALQHHEQHARLEREHLVQRADAQARVLLERLEYEKAKRELALARDDAQAQRARAIELEGEQHRLRAQAEAMARAALEDPLTGLHNRRIIEEMLPALLRAAGSAGTPLALVMLDVDHFKRINDEHGHAVGDRVLAALAQLLRQHTRSSDLLARVGGEEFLLVLPGATIEQGADKCELLREAVECHRWDDAKPGLALTISLGLAALRPDDDSGPLMARADAALYAAKRGGRNRVMAG
ncbi:diguanylate cyclase [Aquincola sp. S2]|uniref:diguanylate cyclase n=1 Tax=Pseudaquabacterium terrae TaxID=2732868 RepID=A0ABX2EK65_9BURK|nr:diguanylate cyclase [Aquabacterium terrae]NRF68934.1 diguanylate cyclase [Aquabacterium terrae]